MSEHKYRLIYQITPKPEGILKKDLPKDVGACDSVVLISMLDHDDGSYSQVNVTLDGATEKPITPNQLFKVWSLLTKELADDKDLEAGKRAFCNDIFEVIREAALKATPKEPEVKETQ